MPPHYACDAIYIGPPGLALAAMAAHYSATQIRQSPSAWAASPWGGRTFANVHHSLTRHHRKTPQHHQAAQNLRDAHTAGELPHATSYPSITTQVQPKIRDTSGGLSLPSIFQAPYPPRKTHCASDYSSVPRPTSINRTENKQCTREDQ